MQARDFRTRIREHNLRSDTFFVWLLVGHFPLVLAFAWGRPTFTQGLVVGALLTILAVVSYFLLRGRLSLRILNGFLLIGNSIILVQVTLGQIEMHFHFFVALAFLLIYRDWRSIVPAAGLIAVHHAIFNVLQEQEVTVGGVPIIVFNYGCGWDIVALHAFFVVFETAILVYYARTLKGEFEGEVRLLRIVERNQQRMLEAFHRLSDLVGEIAQAAETVQSRARRLQVAATTQASSLNETTTSLSHVVARITENTDNATITNRMAGNLSSRAQEAGQSMSDALEAMEKIGQKVTVIDEIAAQTRLLSVNAAIEAVRAAEHGKGFAVVATEVGKLAKLSKESAKTILELARETGETSRGASSILGEVIPDIVKTSRLINDIASSGEAQSMAIDQVNQGMTSLNENARETADSSEELTTISEKLRTLSGELGRVVQDLKKEIDATDESD